MKPRPIAPRSPVMLALDVLEGRVKPAKAPQPSQKPAAKKPPAKKGKPR